MGSVPASADVSIVEEADVTELDERYQISLQLQADASSAVLKTELLKFDRYAELHPSIRSSAVLATEGGVTRVQSLTTRCWFVFCFDIAQVLDYRVDGNRITATVVPEQSDYHQGWLRWELVPLQGDRSEVHFTAELEPGFWIPPLVGSWIIGTEFEQVSVEITRAMIARSRGERIPSMTPSWNPDHEF